MRITFFLSICVNTFAYTFGLYLVGFNLAGVVCVCMKKFILEKRFDARWKKMGEAFRGWLRKCIAIERMFIRFLKNRVSILLNCYRFVSLWIMTFFLTIPILLRKISIKKALRVCNIFWV